LDRTTEEGMVLAAFIIRVRILYADT